MDLPDDPEHFRRLEALYRSAPVNEVLPCQLSVGPGRAEVRLEVGPAFWHAAGSLHGALYFKGLDDAAFFAAQSVERHGFVLTARFELDLLARVTARELRAEGAFESRSGRKIEASARLFAGEEIVARGRGLFLASEEPLSSLPAYRNPGDAPPP
ncbi:MAG: PaaI family thioesterase [Planctomycetota bacterium]|nr:MAG: PaaI family thioesterase [Planctomycetota bacterium]